jgi:hypothetical protein
VAMASDTFISAESLATISELGRGFAFHLISIELQNS